VIGTPSRLRLIRKAAALGNNNPDSETPSLLTYILRYISLVELRHTVPGWVARSDAPVYMREGGGGNGEDADPSLVFHPRHLLRFPCVCVREVAFFHSTGQPDKFTRI
jgi:hypothetical protein